MFRTPRYLQGGNITNSVPGLGFFTSGGTISGNTVTALGNASNGFVAGGPVENQWMNIIADDIWGIHPVSMIAGANTVITTVTINGNTGRVLCQSNTGGFIAAIIIGKLTPSLGGAKTPSGIDPELILINTTGTAPTAVNFGLSYWCLRYPECDWADATSTAAATSRTLTIPEITTGQRVIAAAINDVAAANACTWSGTSGISETDDAALSTARRSYAQSAGTVGASRTVIATFDVISTTGIALAAAMFRIK